MFKDLKSVSILVLVGFSFAVLTFCFPGFLRSDDIARGNVIGFVFDRDGTTPLKDATVKAINVLTGSVYESSRSDSYGVFKIQGIERGLYIYGVETPNGDFNSDSLFGLRIQGNETAKLSISLAPYEGRVASAIKEIYGEQKKDGEALVGQVVSYFPEARMAEVSVMKGLLQLDDRIYTKGDATDFSQDVNYLEHEGSSVKNLFAGQTGFIGVEKEVKTGDLVYTIFKKGILPVLSSPSGRASIITGSSEIVHSPVELSLLCRCPSPWKPWWWYWFCKRFPWYPLCKGYKPW